jgi:hypothetical protein
MNGTHRLQQPGALRVKISVVRVLGPQHNPIGLGSNRLIAVVLPAVRGAKEDDVLRLVVLEILAVADQGLAVAAPATRGVTGGAVCGGRFEPEVDGVGIEVKRGVAGHLDVPRHDRVLNVRAVEVQDIAAADGAIGRHTVLVLGIHLAVFKTVVV